MRLPNTTPGRWPLKERFAAAFREAPEGCSLALIGAPDDTGVRMNHGKTGAAEGPAAFRLALTRYGPRSFDIHHWPAVFDAGDIEPGNSLPETHARLTDVVRRLCQCGLTPLLVGGGHDLSYAFIRGIVEAGGPADVVYFDAHLDVRQEDGSGMAFRRLVADALVGRLHLHGFSPLVNEPVHLEWFLRNGGVVHQPAEPIALPHARRLVASFDLDVLDAAFAPAVSAANPCGWDPVRAEGWIRACGASPSVVGFDLMEFCPRLDDSGRTARLAAHLFATFLAGFRDRDAAANEDARGKSTL